jgi:hypothetical protein
LREGLYGFGLSWLTRIGKPHDLDRFQAWTGAIRVEDGTFHIEETELISEVYNVTMTGEMELESSRLRIHGEGNFHPGWEFDISLKAAVGLVSRLFRLARGRRGHNFEFDVSGTLGWEAVNVWRTSGLRTSRLDIERGREYHLTD